MVHHKLLYSLTLVTHSYNSFSKQLTSIIHVSNSKQCVLSLNLSSHGTSTQPRTNGFFHLKLESTQRELQLTSLARGRCPKLCPGSVVMGLQIFKIQSFWSRSGRSIRSGGGRFQQEWRRGSVWKDLGVSGRIYRI